MASIEVIVPPDWAAPVGYANGITVAAGRIVFIAGQVGWNAQQRFASAEIAPPFEQALQNVLAVPAQAGGQARHICPVVPIILRYRREGLAGLRYACAPCPESVEGSA